ncbi:precorrin-2/cobalt-factor-2 C20-methyltransferase [Pacificibacter maritimus]|uniref:Precorrin-2/cobalt-factor-2 C20-methyltransferase n=1 Tax=Pacificibacter maritimus TaxID=762213 RepID=A0A3N4TXC0_9RHOB|nr:precorrin-2 C(20)-methyltransferase [Pacificibacter maritimus]RPE63203.1 precorrin-2/cobalt-factor-2 C20-methyltransferase [Pacificibacter maritimus]
MTHAPLSQVKRGKVYGIGLGPGDPELMTLKAARLIREASVIAYPTLAGGASFARSIAAEFIAQGTREIVMDVPMTVARGPAQHAYDQGAARIAEALEAGQDVVVLCEGDPFFYGSFMYLFARLRSDFQVEIVPGVTSVTACAAVAQLPLVARNEVMTVLPAPLEDASLRDKIAGSDTVIVMKLGRHFKRVRALIDTAGLTEKSVYIERATGANEVVKPLKDAPETAPYFSMILIVKGADPWL